MSKAEELKLDTGGKLVVVIPVIGASHGAACLDSILTDDNASGFHADELLIVDNTRTGAMAAYQPGLAESAVGAALYRDPDGHNLGVARSWNVGVDLMHERDADYLVICSTSMRFGPILHCTFRSEMRANWGAPLIEAMGHSWHLIAIKRETFDRVGRFDGELFPAYQEATEFGYRLRLVGIEAIGWPNIWCNAMSIGYALNVEACSMPWEPLRDYYKAKWGGMSGHETFTHPFNDPSLPISYENETPIPEIAERYGLDVWW